MKRICFFIVLWGVFNCFCPLYGVESKLKSGDFGIWNYEHFTTVVNENVWFYVETNFRYEQNASFFYYFHEHLQLTWQPWSFFTIAPAYRQAFARSDAGSPGEEPAGSLIASIDPIGWVAIYQPNLNASFLWDFKGLHFRDRSRATYVIIKDFLPHIWTYRNKLSVKTLNTYTPLKLRFLADGEIFIGQRVGFFEYRLSALVSMRLIPKMRFELGYRFVSFKDIDSWFNKNVLLINLRGTF